MSVVHILSKFSVNLYDRIFSVYKIVKKEFFKK